MKRSLHAFLFLFLCGVSAHAQLTSCTQTLRLARATYDQGRLHEIPGLFEKCLHDGGFSQEEKVEAYKLLCLTYIYLEEPQKADEAMLSLLQTDHYFEIKPETDPAEFIALYRSFRTDPVYRVGLKLGANATQPDVTSYLPANDLKSEYGNGISFQTGLTADIPLIKGLTLNPDLLLTLKKFTYSNNGTYEEISTGESREFKTSSIETQTWISLPITVQYQVLKKSKLNPYVSLGFSAEYLLSAKNLYARVKENSTSLNEQSEDMTDYRKKINLSAVAALGSKYKVKGGFMVAEIRILYGLTELNEMQDIYSNFERTNPTNGYVDGIFRLNTASFTIGYVYNIFNPVKIKK